MPILLSIASTDLLLDNLGIRRGTHNEIRPTKLGKRLRLILLGSIDVDVSTELLGKVSLQIGGRESDGLEPALGCELDAQVAETTESLDSDDSSGLKTHVPHRVLHKRISASTARATGRQISAYKGSNPRTKQRSLSWVQFLGNLGHSGVIEGDVFGISSVGHDTVDTLLETSNVVALKGPHSVK